MSSIKIEFDDNFVTDENRSKVDNYISSFLGAFNLYAEAGISALLKELKGKRVVARENVTNNDTNENIINEESGVILTVEDEAGRKSVVKVFGMSGMCCELGDMKILGGLTRDDGADIIGNVIDSLNMKVIVTDEQISCGGAHVIVNAVCGDKEFGVLNIEAKSILKCDDYESVLDFNVDVSN